MRILNRGVADKGNKRGDDGIGETGSHQDTSIINEGHRDDDEIHKTDNKNDGDADAVCNTGTDNDGEQGNEWNTNNKRRRRETKRNENNLKTEENNFDEQ